MAPAVVANESLTSDVASSFAAERAAQYMPRCAVSGGKLAGCMSMERENSSEMGASQSVRVGLAGVGRFGKLHASVLSDLPGVELVDSNGAGDAYFSGFLYGFSKGYNLLKCMQTGSIAGALCINSSFLFHPELSSGIVESMYKNHFGKR